MTAIVNLNKGMTATILYVNLIENPNKGMVATLCKLDRESE
jgi:hypothetical protein